MCLGPQSPGRRHSAATLLLKMAKNEPLKAEMGQKGNCLSCIGPPDHAFERACAAVAALEIAGVGKPEAEKFVRLLCTQGGGDAVRLSKSKAKAAAKSIRAKTSGLPPLDPEALERMQTAVLDAYPSAPSGNDAS